MSFRTDPPQLSFSTNDHLYSLNHSIQCNHHQNIKIYRAIKQQIRGYIPLSTRMYRSPKLRCPSLTIHWFEQNQIQTCQKTTRWNILGLRLTDWLWQEYYIGKPKLTDVGKKVATLATITWIPEDGSRIK